MRFTINLATRTYLDHRRVNQLIFAIAFLMVALLAWNVSRISRNFGELNLLKSDADVLERRLNSRPSGVQEKDFNRLLGDIRFYNDIIERKANSWINILDQMENSTPEGIALISLTPDRKSGEIKIEGRTKTFAQVQLYLEKLENSGNFTNILLQSHRDMVFGERTRGVEFSISCRMVKR